MGFDHFDGSGSETFAAALLLLCIDEDVQFQSTLVTRLRQIAGLAGDAHLVDYGREEGLDVRGTTNRRSDLWLRFEDGIVLVEIKTHSAWPPSSVARQMEDQRQAKWRDERVLEAVLLAPGRLLRWPEIADVPKLSWQLLIDLAEEVPYPTRILELAIAHWSDNVERDLGLSSTVPMLPLDSAAAQTACLVALLRAAILRLGGTVRGDTVWFTSANGRPKTNGEWTWFGVAVPGRLPTQGRVNVGIYTYTMGPTLGSFLEAYDARDRELASVAFAPADLSPDHLDAVLTAFSNDYTARLLHTDPTATR